MNMSDKGIVRYARNFTIFGVNAFYIGILVKTCREGRLLELAASLCHHVQNFFSGVEDPREATDESTYCDLIYAFDLKRERFFARRQGVWSGNGMTVACEYEQPGARIMVLHNGNARIFRPYAGTGVWHLHALAHLGGDHFAVSTGDTIKALDIFRITPSECTLLRRAVSRLAGYTAMLNHNGSLWGGSDFTERPNFLTMPDEGRKYFLPKSCIKEYVTHITALDADRLLVFSRRLGTLQGHALIFCTAERKFTACNAIDVCDFHENVEVYAQAEGSLACTEG